MITNGNAFTTPQATGSPERAYPLKDHPEHFTIEREMMVFAEHYEGPPLDEPDTFYQNAYCVGDSGHTSEGPILKFDRKWATVPQARDFYSSINYTYPSMGETPGVYSVREEQGVVHQDFVLYTVRTNPITLNVPSRVHVEYYLPGVSGVNSIEDIPTEMAFRLLDSDGHEVSDLTATNATPDVNEYAIWIISEMELCARSTKLERYLGNIWKAQTEYVKAK